MSYRTIFSGHILRFHILSLILHRPNCPMKRFTAIFFILLANICLLAHAVIPHHHHNRVAVAVVDVTNLFDHPHHAHGHSHSHESPHSHYHHSHRNHESHQHDSHAEDCLISDGLFASFRSQGADLGWQNDDGAGFQTDFICAAYWDFCISQSAETQQPSFIYQTNVPPGADVCSNGLRAPPYC